MRNGDKEEVFRYDAAMGRKSNTKKQIREILKDDKKSKGKSKKVSKKDLKKELQESEKVASVTTVKSEPTEPQIEIVQENKPPRFHRIREKLHTIKHHKQKIFGGLLALIMAGMLVSFSFLLFQKTFRPEPVAKLLPAKDTVALVEINVNSEHNQVIKTEQLLKKYPEYSRENILTTAATNLGLDYAKDLKPWLGRQVAVAFVNAAPEENTVHELYFAEIANRELLDEFLKRKPENIYTTFANDYIVFAKNEKALASIKDVKDELYDSDKYRRIDDNLPIQKLALFYLDFANLNDSFFNHFPFLTQKGLSTKKIGPLLNTLDGEGMALIALDDRLAVQSFLSLDAKVVDTFQAFPSKEKYDANLAKYLPTNTLVFWGGENIGNQLKRLSEIMAGGEMINVTIFDQLVQNYTQQYFGKDVNFNRDILPLVKKEFAFTIEKKEDQQIYKFLLQLNDPQEDKVKLQQLANNFASIGAIFQPKIVETVLQDGTVSREIVAVPEEVTTSESIYNEYQIYELKLGEKNWGLYYAFLDDVAVFATQKAGVISSIDTIGTDKNLHSSQLFLNSITPVLRNADEVSYFDFTTISEILGTKDNWPKFTTIIDAVSTGRNYFNDGIITLNYLHLK